MTPDWSRKFEGPFIIVRPRGPRGKERQLVTLKDAGEFIAKLPKAEHTATEWQTAMQALLLAVRGGPRRLTMYLATLDCATSNPSLSSSP
jgi:hypothetical protein